MRTTFVVFWKATAIFQFGVAVAWGAPMLYKNQNQPDENVRYLQTVGFVLVAAVPMLAMSYLTAPFVKRVAIEIPDPARRSLHALLAFSRNVPPATRLEFTTLRAFPWERTTGVTMSDLRAIPAQKGRFANIELVKTKQYLEHRKKKGILMKVWEVLAEPRWKFYVKEGRSYTIKTRVPGVWENIAVAIKQQTLKEAEKELERLLKMKKALKTGHKRPMSRALPAIPIRISPPEAPKLRRQTLRSQAKR
ncbi:hypothetical protein K504DRAFT_471887 [Pleomassaria siparia CBS 279.74]|uniref:Uncharacterized protein n=1 Tax=Pleomassaria siparia CBS 279.74 TaxID=1314801 RepID=A0A6G1JXG3_9PLEO|nr:hypothetical protein K504DRAFT_471887 [Pleomassaria siparia CBS 279.74]